MVIAIANTFASWLSEQLRWAKLKVTAMLDTSPPSRPVRPMPRRAPTTFIDR